MTTQAQNTQEGPIARAIRTARKYHRQGLSEEEIVEALREGWEDWPVGMIEEVVTRVRLVVFDHRPMPVRDEQGRWSCPNASCDDPHNLIFVEDVARYWPLHYDVTKGEPFCVGGADEIDLESGKDGRLECRSCGFVMEAPEGVPAAFV